MAKTAAAPRKPRIPKANTPAPSFSDSDLPQVKDRYVGLIRGTYDSARVKQVLEGTGISAPLYYQSALFERLMETWPRVDKNLNEMATSVSGADFMVKPFSEKGDDPTPESQEKAKFIERLVFGMTADARLNRKDFKGTVFSLMDAYGKGLSVLEIDWDAAMVDGEYRPLGTRWLKSNYYDYPYAPPSAQDRLMLSRSGQPMNDLADFPANKFIIGSYLFRTSNHLGRGALLRSLAPYWIYTNLTTEWVMTFAMIFGMPIRWATYKPGDDKELIKRFLANMGNLGWGVFPDGTNLNLHQPTQSASQNPNAYCLERFDHMADLHILGQTLTSDVSTNGGNRALGEVHERGLTGRKLECANWAADTLTDQLVRAIMLLNYGNTDEMPVIAVKPLEEHVDPLTKANAAKVWIRDIGLKVAKDALYEQAGYAAPGDDDDIFEPPAEPDTTKQPDDASQDGEDSTDTETETDTEDPATEQKREKALAAMEKLQADPQLIAAIADMSQENLVACLDGMMPLLTNKNARRYRGGQKGGGRFMSAKIVAAMEKVKAAMATYPRMSQHRGDRFIEAFGLKDSAGRFNSYVTKTMPDEVDQRARRVKKTTDLPVDDLIPTQSRIDGEKVMGMLMSVSHNEDVHKTPIVIKRAGRNWIWDGHHRVAKAKMLSEENLRCRYVDCEDLKD